MAMMIRLSVIVAAFLAGCALALPADPPPLKQPVASNQCKNYTKGQGYAAICAPLFEVSSALMYQGNNIDTEVDKILKVINSAIPSGNPIGKLTELITLHLISNVDYADGAVITGVAAALQNATPQCKCDLAACYSALTAAAQSTSIGADNSQAACAEANYACSPYYSQKQVDHAAPKCAKYTGTTNN